MKSDRESGSKPALIDARHQAHVLRSLAQIFRLAFGGSRRKTFQTGGLGLAASCDSAAQQSAHLI
jgi:hypothetical protein